MKKRTLALMLSTALCVGMLAGCGSSNDTTNTPAADGSSPAADGNTPATELSGTVVTNGSTSMESVMGALTEAFKEVQPNVQVQYTGSGSGAGITSAQDGTADIGLASRDLKDDETGVTQITVAKDGIAIIVNPENPVADLSVEQIAQLATGEITNWSEVGGNDAEVVFIGREAGSGTRDGFETITGTTDACKYQNELTSTGEVIANVASNPNAIGYASLSAVDDTVKAITVGGVAPSEETVLDGSYAIQRNFNFILNESTPLSDAAQAFVDWATSADAADLIAGAGAVPVAE
ncbi:phosphate ABC transporter substrate-binding protein [Intestinimonas massiliensis (ex Afouda et al. 2020)]|uniref:phosphate ABC transporter substrate-binding protein n=1 Tax=Intestinimonas massiliensis (ex Afouda et al. 2020) TaxID=1673721 RepID=UPI00102F9C0D|nr:phosphate ABC transporter substrate-binding protein [Intestinimonas massiliensis (ex Afouda et al. 2020)]